MAKIIKQAYKTAPWRRQIQAIGLSLIPIVFLVVGVSIYLVVSAQAAAAGLEIMDMHFREEDILRQIANQRSNLAYITSFTQMQKKAQKIGFVSPETDQIHHMVINGYQGQKPVLIAPPPGDEGSPSSLVNLGYQQSLSTWLYDTFFSPSESGSISSE